MKKQHAPKLSRKTRQTSHKFDTGYDKGVEASGPGLENLGELIAPAAIGDQLGPYGKPLWDDSERAPPPASASEDGQSVSAASKSLHHELSMRDLRERARVLSIPGRGKMTKMQLAIAVQGSSGPTPAPIG